MFCKMAGQNFLMEVGMLLNHFDYFIFEPASTRVFADSENRAKRHVQKLPAHDFIEVKSFVGFGLERAQRLNLCRRRRQVIALAVVVETPTAKGDDFAE